MSASGWRRSRAGGVFGVHDRGRGGWRRRRVARRVWRSGDSASVPSRLRPAFTPVVAVGGLLALVVAFFALRPVVGSSASGEEGSALLHQGPAPPVMLILGDDEARPSRVVLERDRPVSLTIRNPHYEMHHFIVEDLDLHVDVPAGGARTVTFRPTRAGRWRSTCVFEHEESVTLVVR